MLENDSPYIEKSDEMEIFLTYDFKTEIIALKETMVEKIESL